MALSLERTPATSAPPDDRDDAGSYLLGGLRKIAVAAPLIVVGVQLVYDVYYDPLDTSAEEVGRSVASMVLLPAAFLSMMAALVAIATFCAVLWHRRGKVTTRLERGLSLAAAGCLALVLCWLMLALLTRVPWLMPVAMVMGVVAFLVTFSTPASVLRREQLRVTRNWLAVFFVVGFLAVWVALSMQAGDSSKSLEADGSSSRPGIASLLNVEARPVCAQGLGGPLPSSIPTDRTVLLLGSANGVSVLRDVVEDRTLRVPSGAVLFITPSGPTCR